jgi:thiamine-phosphate pyrophosphorylase
MKNFELPKIYPITDTRLSGLSHAEQVERLIAGGATFIQLREKHRAPKDFYAEAVEAVEVVRKHPEVKILINDRVDIVLAAKADGVHLGQTDLPPVAARQILGENAIIGYSTHSVEQAVEASQLPLDYIAVGSIFQTTTKEKPEAILGLENLRQIRAALKGFPLVAIGGITAENARSVIEAGANSIALISALLKDRNIISETTRDFVRKLAADERG